MRVGHRTNSRWDSHIFSPLFETEFHRVLKQKGILIRVIPLETHLHELREVVYDHPYDNDVPDLNIEGFQIIKKEELKYTITLETTEDILSLFRMTPYFYKTGREDQEKLEHCEQLTTSIEFGIIVYEKK